jgi:hypothetical protein
MDNGDAKRFGLEKRQSRFKVFRPNTGLQASQPSLDYIQKEFVKISNETAKMIWKTIFESSLKKISMRECNLSLLICLFFLLFSIFYYTGHPMKKCPEVLQTFSTELHLCLN